MRKAWRSCILNLSVLTLGLLLLNASRSYGHVTFTDVTSQAGATAQEEVDGYGHGVAFGDFNNDGFEDLYLLVNLYDNYLFISRGDGTFEERAADAGVRGPGNGVGDRCVNIVDYDNDGDLDIYLTNSGSNNLYRNNGGVHFSDVSWASGATGSGSNLGEHSSWCDYNNDGYIDFFTSNWDERCALFKNNGDGTFTDVTTSAGISIDQGYSPSNVWFDYDNDGNLDLFVSRAVENPNWLWRNNGDGTFTDVASQAGLVVTIEGHGSAAADYNNDGFIDLYQTSDKGANALYRNNGNGTFTEVGAVARVDDERRTLAGAWGDFDNDGWLDLFITNYRVPNCLYFNNGDGTFSVDDSFFEDWEAGYSITLGDYNNDGFLDIYHSNSGQKSRLFRNDRNSNHWLKIRLQGVQSNSYGIGARIEVLVGSAKQDQEVTAGSGYTGQNSLIINFGLAGSTVADKVIVHWPSGARQVLTNVAADQKITIVEADNSIFNIAGMVSYYSNALSVDDVRLDVDNGNQTFDNSINGQYAFDLDGWENHIITPEKMTNHSADGWAVDMYDAALTAQHAIGLITLNDMQQIAAQIDSTGEITFFNAAQIARYAVGLNPVGSTIIGSWKFSPASRIYVDLEANQANQNYQAILAGDVSGSWSTQPPLSRESQVTNRLSESYVIQDDTLILPFYNIRNSAMIAFDLSLDYPDQYLEFVEIVKSPRGKDISFVFNKTENNIRVGGYSVKQHNDDSELFALKFHLRTNVVPADRIVMNHFRINNSISETSMMSLTEIQAGNTQPRSFSLMQNYPNPFNSSTVIPLTIPESDDVTIQIYNQQGALVRILVNGRLKQGNHSIHWDGMNNEGVTTASGIYFVQVNYRHEIKFLKLVTIR